MIFTSLTEREQALTTIEEKGTFDNLTDIQMATIRGMYYAIEVLENSKYDFTISEDDTTVDKIQKETAESVTDDAIDSIVLEILEMYVAFCDDNAEI